jgi:hypothetical protein
MPFDIVEGICEFKFNWIDIHQFMIKVAKSDGLAILMDPQCFL